METFEQKREEAVEKALTDLSEDVRRDLIARVYEMMNPSERKLTESENTPTFRATRNWYFLERKFVYLPSEMKMLKLSALKRIWVTGRW